MTNEVTSIRRPDDDVRGVEQTLFRYEVARRRSAVVISVAQGEDDDLKLVVERGADKLRDALAHPRPVKADVVLRFAAAPAERTPLSKAR
jgi:hypothetical protein